MAFVQPGLAVGGHGFVADRFGQLVVIVARVAQRFQLLCRRGFDTRPVCAMGLSFRLVATRRSPPRSLLTNPPPCVAEIESEGLTPS